MSHSRNRRPSRTREPARNAPADCATNTAKENGGAKDKIKIPKNVRYDLENALLGLCDVWFEDIKPHLIKNNVKLHTGGTLSEPVDEVEPATESRWDGRRQIDPGAASNTRHRAVANSRAYSLTQPAASKAPCPNLKPPLRTRPKKPTNFCKLLQLPDNEKMRLPTAARRVLASGNSPPVTKNYQRNVYSSSKKRDQPPVQKTRLLRSPPSTQTLQRKLPNPMKRKTSQRASSPTFIQTYQTKLCMPSEQNASTDRRKRKAMQTRKTKPILSSRSPYPNRVSPSRCVACAFAMEQIKAMPQQSYAVRTELPRAKNTPLKRSDNGTANFSQPKCQQTSVSTQDRGVLTDWPFDATTFWSAGDVSQSLQAGGYTTHKHNHPSTATTKQRCRRKFPCSLRHDSVLQSPLHARCLAPPERPIASPRENQPVSAILSQVPSSDQLWLHPVFKKYTRPQNQRNPPTKEHTVDKRRPSKHTVAINNENILQFEDEKLLFSKDLIDLIGDKNDERLRVLYENPTRQELQQSIMCLAGPRKIRIKANPKKVPWR